MATVTVLAIATLTLAAIQITGGRHQPVGERATQCPSAERSPIGSCVALPSTSPSLSAASTVDPTGILIVAIGEQVQAGAAGEVLAVAFSQALQFAMDHPDDFGYPWLDPATRELVFSVATNEGRSLIDAFGRTVTVPYRIREVEHSYTELQQIQNAVTFLRSEGVADAELIYKVLPDERDNRTLIVMSELSRALLQELAARFPPEAIAVQVDPNQPPLGY
ncbi:MAG TPA: hypothetical protein VGQ66_03755 [Candidatus Limnocylindria bacterium]|nr:hypothetical protein [Candidatus Limnocylindria bacterium]